MKGENGMRKRFAEKVVMVTGGAHGLGEADVISFANEGAKVVIADIDEEAGQSLADRLNADGFETLFVKTDVTKEDQVISLVAKTVEKFGKLDVLVANAGIGGTYAAPIDQTEEDLDLIYNVNIKGVFLTNKHAVKQMIKQGTPAAIVNMGSIESILARANTCPYNATKGAVKLMTQSFARAYAPNNIRFNAVCPGVILTPLVEKLTQSPEHRQMMIDLHPLGRLGDPQDVANAVLFLASEESAFITGSCLMVDGGHCA